MRINRRSFLKNVSAGALGVGLSNFLPISRMALAQSGSPKHFIVVNLSGGLDSHFAFPFLGATEQLVTARRPGIAVPTGDRFSLNGQIGMHNSLAVLNTGNVGNLLRNNTKFFTMAGVPNHNQLGHEGARKVMDILSPDIAGASSGWIGRAKESLDPYSCFGVASRGLAFLPNGKNSCLQLSSLESYKFSFENFSAAEQGRVVDAAKKLLAASKTATVNPPLRKDVEQIQAMMHESIPLIEQIKSVSVAAANYAPTTTNTYIGERFKDTARIVTNRHAAGVSTIIEVAHGGYDSHANQTEVLTKLLTELSYGLYGFLNDMIAKGMQNSVTVLVTSEFGRSNGATDSGTDHGYGMTAMTIGGAVVGGNNKTVYGEIPDSTAINQHFMPVTQDIRNVYYHILKWLGVDPLTVIIDPSFSPNTGMPLFT